MYIPAVHRVEDPEVVADFMEKHSFATLVTSTAEGASFANHVPLLLDRTGGLPGKLIGHLARANPHARLLPEGCEVLVIFQGPHGYISPRWYATPELVPTWNYAAVHAYGTARVIEDGAFLEDVLAKTVARYEGTGPGAWKEALPAELRAGLFKAIVGFEIDLHRVEGKFKLSQNRKPADLARVIDTLVASGDAEDHALAALMLEVNEPLSLAVPGDVPTLLALATTCVAHMRSHGIDQWDEVYPSEAVIARDIAAGTLHVLRWRGEIIACFTLDDQLDPLWQGLDWTANTEPAAAIHRLMVHPDHQGRGLARRLVSRAEALAQAQGFRSLRLDCFSLNPAALRLYEKLGYRRTGTAMMRKGEFVGFEKGIL